MKIIYYRNGSEDSTRIEATGFANNMVVIGYAVYSLPDSLNIISICILEIAK